MKGCVAAFITAAKELFAANPNHKGSLAILLTSDEEGLGINGTAAVLKEFKTRNLKIDYCLVGEPSSEEALADVERRSQGIAQRYASGKGNTGTCGLSASCP